MSWNFGANRAHIHVVQILWPSKTLYERFCIFYCMSFGCNSWCHSGSTRCNSWSHSWCHNSRDRDTEADETIPCEEYQGTIVVSIIQELG